MRVKLGPKPARKQQREDPEAEPKTVQPEACSLLPCQKQQKRRERQRESGMTTAGSDAVGAHPESPLQVEPEFQTPPKKQRLSVDAEFSPDCKSTELRRSLQRSFGSVDEPEIEEDTEPATFDPYWEPGEAETRCGQPLFQFCSTAQQQLLALYHLYLLPGQMDGEPCFQRSSLEGHLWQGLLEQLVGTLALVKAGQRKRRRGVKIYTHINCEP